MSDDLRTLATGLGFPEGPVWLDDDTIAFTEIARGQVTTVSVATGETAVLADTGGGPNGLALAADGAILVTNNGAFFTWFEADGVMIPGPTPDEHRGGSVQRIEVDTGAVTTLFETADGVGLVAPNDLVVDGIGGVYFTDHGVQHGNHVERPGLSYLPADGSEPRALAFGLDSANGVGTSPDGSVVYVAETHPGRVWAFDVIGEGRIANGGDPATAHQGRLLHDAADGVLFDSLAVHDSGWVVVATIGVGGLTCISPDGGEVVFVDLPDPITTNVAFRTLADGSEVAAVTLSSSGTIALLTALPEFGG